MYNSALALKKGIQSTFAKMLQTKKENIFKDFIYRGSSNTNEEDYWIPESLPGFQEWLDNITYSDFDDNKLTVKNKHWQRGFTINRDFLDDSRKSLGNQVEQFLKMVLDKYVSFPDTLCQTLLEANSNAFDATAFFSASRANLDTGSNTINNLVDGTLSEAYNTSTFSADFDSAEQLLLNMKDRDNEPFNSMPQLVAFVPVQLRNIAEKILSEKAETYIDAGTSVQTTNVYSGRARIAINYRQSNSDNDWYLINVANPFQPFVIQDRQGVKWHMKDDEEVTFLKYWAEFRMGYEFLNPMSIVKVNN